MILMSESPRPREHLIPALYLSVKVSARSVEHLLVKVFGFIARSGGRSLGHRPHLHILIDTLRRISSNICIVCRQLVVHFHTLIIDILKEISVSTTP